MNKEIKKIKKTDLSITVGLIIGIIVVVNFFSYQIFYRWDLTDDNIYSISSATKKTVNNLDDIVNIKAYFSNNLPSQVLSIKQEVADILDEYEAYSNGKIKVEFIDPNDDEETQRELYALGIPQLTFEVYEKDKTQLVNGYMGIAISFADNTEAIPAIKRNTSALEYQLTTAIKKVITDEIATIGYLNTHSTLSLTEELQTAQAELSELYEIREVSINEDGGVPIDIDTLIIAGPKESFSDEELQAINLFLMRGGALLALVDGVKIEQGLLAQKNNTGLDEFFSKYGINLGGNLVADARSGMASFSQGFVTFSTPYPFWPKITSEGFNKDNSAVANLENVILPWASSISIDETKIANDSYTNLLQTTNKAWQMIDNFNVSPNGPATKPQGTQQEFTLGVLVNGILPNAYPAESSEESTNNFNGRIVVIGDSEFISDGFLRNSPDNLNLFLNLVDVLSFDEDLISIRSKGASSRPIKELSDTNRVAVRYLNIFGLTLLVVVFGLVRYYLRRRSRFVDDL